MVRNIFSPFFLSCLHWVIYSASCALCLCLLHLVLCVTLKRLQGKSGVSLRFTFKPIVAYTPIVFPSRSLLKHLWDVCSLPFLFLANASRCAQFKRWVGTSGGNQFTSPCVLHFQDLNSVISNCCLSQSPCLVYVLNVVKILLDLNHRVFFFSFMIQCKI